MKIVLVRKAVPLFVVSKKRPSDREKCRSRTSGTFAYALAEGGYNPWGSFC